MKMMRTGFFCILALGVLCLLTSHGALAAVLEADMVIYNGKILTADSADPNDFTVAQAAAIYNGKFVVVGSNEQALELAGQDTRRIDLGGRTVIPGLVETHDHIYGYGEHFFPEGSPRVGGTDSITWPSKADAMAQIRTLALTKKPGEWIIATPRGYRRDGAGLIELYRGDATRFDLDKVAPDNPVHLHWGSAEGLLNTKALEPLLERYPKIPGLRLNEEGVPTGVVAGVANYTMVYEFWPQIPAEHLAPYYKMEMEEVAAQGLTTVSSRLQPNHLAAYSWLHARGEMPTRMAYTLETAARNPNTQGTISRLVGLQGGSGKNMWGAGDDKLWMIGLSPLSIDSVPGIAGSCINKPYPREAPDFPLWLHQFYGPNGLCRLTDPDYNDIELLRGAAKYGFRVAGMHSGGDRGIDQYLDAVEELSKQYPDIVEQRWSIDHCRFLTDEHAARSKKLGIMFSCGPKYVYGGKRGDIGAYSVIYGEQVAEDVVVPLRRLLDHGVRTTMELDQHGFHPFLAMEVTVNRKDMNGKVWGPRQRINRREAFYMYTRWSSEYVLKEDRLGTIETNKLADFVVLNRDYLTVPEDEIGQIDPVLTVMDGKLVYTEPEFSRSVGLPTVGFQGDRSHWKRGIEGEGDSTRQ